jgi:uncharacterized protein (DUF58 family)
MHYRRIYILPTRAGWGFAFLLFCMFVAGLNYSNSTALFLTFWLAGFVLVGLHRCHRNLLGIALQGATAVPTFAGGAGELELTLENPAPLMRLRIEADLPGVAPSVTDIAPRSAARLNLALPTTVRGRLLIDGLRLTTALPFGLFRAWTWVYLPLELIVYPRARGFLPLPTVAGVTPGARTRGGSGGDEWLGLRAFRDGDSPHQVAWKAYARGAPLLVKEYCAAAAPERYFDFERLPNLDTERRLEQLAAWIVDAEKPRRALRAHAARRQAGAGSRRTASASVPERPRPAWTRACAPCRRHCTLSASRCDRCCGPSQPSLRVRS